MKLNTHSMKFIAVLLATLFAADHYALAAEAGMPTMPGMSMPANNAEAQTGHAMGVVNAVNATANTVTIATEAVPERQWPAMTMEYKVEGTAAANISAGQKVKFEFVGPGMDVTITKIEKME